MKRMGVILGAFLGVVLSAAVALAYQTRIGGTLAFDLFYAIQSGPCYAGAAGTRDIRQPDLTSFNTQVSSGTLTFWFFSDDRSVGAHLTLSMTAGPAAGAQVVQLMYLYGWYRFGRCRLSIGHMDNMFAAATYAPYAGLGFQTLPDGSGGFFEFGKLYSGRFAQAALYYGLGRWQFMIALGAVPRNTNNWPAYRGNQNVITGYARYPRLDLAVEYQGKYFSLAPGLSVYRTEWEPWEGAVLEDKHVWSMALVIPFRVTVGNFGLTGEVGYARNWRVPNMLNTWQGGLWWGSGWPDNLDRIKVADTTTYTACLGLYYRVGRATVWLSGGWQMSQNGSSDVFGGWRHGQNVRYALVLAVPYRVNSHFSVAPEVGYYFFGWDPTQDVGGPSNWGTPGGATTTSTTADRGSAWLLGIRFLVRF